MASSLYTAQILSVTFVVLINKTNDLKHLMNCGRLNFNKLHEHSINCIITYVSIFAFQCMHACWFN